MDGFERITGREHEELVEKCQENGWLKVGGFDWQDDPFLEEYPYEFSRTDSVDRLREALGSGNWTGVGFAESRLKHKYLPEAHTDFILSIVGEELGYVWMCVVILAYVVFVTLAIAISTRARTRQGMLLAFGLTTFIAVQAIINIGVISGAWPTKGMPAPFISYGGSSLVSCLVATGLIISVALDAAYPDYHLGVAARIRETFNRWNPFHKK